MESGGPNRFFHGFVLGLIVNLSDRYVITSHRESVFGWYDVMLEPRSTEYDAILLEFKVQDEAETELSYTEGSTAIAVPCIILRFLPGTPS